MASPRKNRPYVGFESRQRTVGRFDPVLAAQINAHRVLLGRGEHAVVQEDFGQVATIKRVGRGHSPVLPDRQADRFAETEKRTVAVRPAAV